MSFKKQQQIDSENLYGLSGIKKRQKSDFSLRGLVDWTHPLAGLHLLSSQEPLHLDALIRQLTLEGRRLSGRHRHVLQRTQQPDGASWRRRRRRRGGRRRGGHGYRDQLDALRWSDVVSCHKVCEAAESRVPVRPIREQPLTSDNTSKINSGADWLKTDRDTMLKVTGISDEDFKLTLHNFDNFKPEQQNLKMFK